MHACTHNHYTIHATACKNVLISDNFMIYENDCCTCNLISTCVVVDWDMYAHALCGGGVLLEFVYRLCRYVMSCVIQHMVRA